MVSKLILKGISYTHLDHLLSERRPELFNFIHGCQFGRKKEVNEWQQCFLLEQLGLGDVLDIGGDRGKGVSKMICRFCLEQLCVGGPIYWNGEEWKRGFWSGRYDSGEIKIFYVKFKMPVRNQRAHVKWLDEYMSMEFRRKISTTDNKLGKAYG